MLDKKFHPRFPVVAGKDVFVDECFSVGSLPAFQGLC